MAFIKDTFTLHTNKFAKDKSVDLSSIEYVHVFKSLGFPPQENGSYNYLVYELLQKRKNKDIIICQVNKETTNIIESSDFPIFGLQLFWSSMHKFLFKHKNPLLKYYNSRVPIFYLGIKNILGKNKKLKFLVWGNLESCKYLRRLFPHSYISFSQRKYNFQTNPESLYNCCNTVVFQGPSQLKEAINTCFRFIPAPYVIPNGVDLFKYKKRSQDECTLLRKECNIPQNKFVIIFPSKLSHYKGLSWLGHIILESLKINKNIFFLIPGKIEAEYSPDLYPELANLMNDNSNVKFLKGTDKSQMSKLYSISNICLMTNAEKEGFSMASIEAMATGLPVICPPFGTFVDYVKDGYNGFLFNYENPIQDACSKITILHQNPELLNKMSENCIEFVRTKLSRKKLLNNYEAFLNHDFVKIDSSMNCEITD